MIFGKVALFPLGTALAFALYIIVTRVLSRELHPVPMQFHTALLGFAISAPILLLASGSGIASLALGWPAGAAWWFLAGVGLASTVSHMAITYALKFAPSATLAPLHYLEIISAVFFGYLVFGDFPSLLTWAGIAVIAASGLYVIHRERRLSRQIPVTLP
jgi:drug/metabolite transporter (DMT)-like permease